MSRIGKKPIIIPEVVEITLDRSNVKVKGPLGELSLDIHHKIKIEQNEREIIVKPLSQDKLARSLHGLTRMLISNAVVGVTIGFKKQLEIKGVGYKAQLKDEAVELNLGFSHPVEYKIPSGIKIEIVKHIITVSGIDKQAVGQVAAEIRRLKLPEPYKGKGIRYLGEEVRRKAGKTVKTGE